MILSELIKQLRKKAGLTQLESAELTHVNLRSWQRWEGAERECPLNIIELYCVKTKQNFDEIKVKYNEINLQTNKENTK